MVYKIISKPLNDTVCMILFGMNCDAAAPDPSLRPSINYRLNPEYLPVMIQKLMTAYAVTMIRFI